MLNWRYKNLTDAKLSLPGETLCKGSMTIVVGEVCKRGMRDEIFPWHLWITVG